MIGVALYWAEGSKTDSTYGFNFINTDPDMIKLMCVWLCNIAGIDKKDIKACVCINSTHKYRINDVLKFWSSLLKLPLSQFSDTYFSKVKRKNTYQNHENYYGLLRLRVVKSANLRYKIQGLIGIIKDMPM